VNGPIRKEIKLNCETGLMGSGSQNRANASIGRALKLILQNVGGAKLGGTESSTLGSANKWTLCIGEREELIERGGEKPGWETYHEGRGYHKTDSIVTVMAITGGPYQLVDFKTTAASDLCRSMARIIKVLYEPRIPLLNNVLCVISPEHYKLLISDGISSRERFRETLFRYTAATMTEDLPFILSNLLGPRIAEKKLFRFLGKIQQVFRGVALVGSLCLYFSVKQMFSPPMPGFNRNGGWRLITNFLGKPLVTLPLLLALLPGKWHLKILGYALRSLSHVTGLVGYPISPVSKVTSSRSFHVIVAGGGAGKFSAFFPGFGVGHEGPLAHMNRPVSRKVGAAPGVEQQKARLSAFLLNESGAEDSKESTNSRMIVNPTGKTMKSLKLAARTGKIAGPIALLDISKGNGDVLLDRIEELLKSEDPNFDVRRFKKPTFSRPCPPELVRSILDSGAKHCVAALAD